MGKRGAVRRTIYTKVIRIQLTDARRGLLSFFEQLEKLPRGKRDDVLLDAIQHGAVKAQEKMAQNESAAVERAIDNILDGF
jgi:hypothetical protein